MKNYQESPESAKLSEELENEIENGLKKWVEKAKNIIKSSPNENVEEQIYRIKTSVLKRKWESIISQASESRMEKKNKSSYSASNSSSLNEKKEFTAYKFFFTKIYPELKDENDNEITTIKGLEIITSANEYFQKENSKINESFWKKLDKEIFWKNEKKFLKKGIKKPDGLGILKIASTDAILKEEVFEKIIAIYNKEYNSNRSDLMKTIDEDDYNILHTIADLITLKTSVKKEDWKVYFQLAEEFPELVIAENCFGKTPIEIIESAEISIGEEVFYFNSKWK